MTYEEREKNRIRFESERRERDRRQAKHAAALASESRDG